MLSPTTHLQHTSRETIANSTIPLLFAIFTNYYDNKYRFLISLEFLWKKMCYYKPKHFYIAFCNVLQLISSPIPLLYIPLKSTCQIVKLNISIFYRLIYTVVYTFPLYTIQSLCINPQPQINYGHFASFKQ